MMQLLRAWNSKYTMILPFLATCYISLKQLNVRIGRQNTVKSFFVLKQMHHICCMLPVDISNE